MGKGYEHARSASLVGILTGVALFVFKLLAALITGSVSALGAAANSLGRVLAELGYWSGVHPSHKRAAKGRAFARARASPMGGLVAAAAILLLGVEVLRRAFFGDGLVLVTGSTTGALMLLIFAVVAELLLSDHLHRRRGHNPNFRVIAADVRNDMVITLLAMVAIAFDVPFIDRFLGALIGAYLVHASWLVAKQKLDYLTGQQPPKRLEHAIREVASSVHGVRGLTRVSVHHVGTFTHADVHIVVNAKVSERAAHVIAMTVQHDLERLPGVAKAFVTLDRV